MNRIDDDGVWCEVPSLGANHLFGPFDCGPYTLAVGDRVLLTQAEVNIPEDLIVVAPYATNPKILQGSAVINFGSISAGAVATATITVTGAVAGDCVKVGVPAAFNAGLMWSEHVTAADTVTLRVYNTTGGAIDPASGTFKATVVRG